MPFEGLHAAADAALRAKVGDREAAVLIAEHLLAVVDDAMDQFGWPGDAVLRISGFDAEVAGAYLLAEPSRKLPIAREHGGIALSLPARCPDEIDTVVVLELGGPLLVD